MKSILISIALFSTCASTAFANVGECKKPDAPDIPQNVASLSLSEYSTVYEVGESYFADAKSYLKCLDQIIYKYAPEEPIVNQAGKAHPNYINEWGPVWGDFNLACVNWEASHGREFPGGCQPSNPGM